MKHNKKYWFLLFGLVVLLLTSAAGCGQPGFTTYNNDVEGYSISYPLSWGVEVSKDGTICLITSPTRVASVMIYVADSMSAQTAAQYWLMSLGTQWYEITQIENKPMEGTWNWYVSYDYEANTGPFHGEAYFKSTADHLYRLDTAADSAGYGTYPFSAIVSSFKLK
ncbi:MAG TPA: hypothetical protein VF366_04010 [Dehalococcoidia bacterium]